MIRLGIDDHSITSRRLYVRKPLDGTKILFCNLNILCANMRSSAYNGPTDRPTDRPNERSVPMSIHAWWYYTPLAILYHYAHTYKSTLKHTRIARRWREGIYVKIVRRWSTPLPLLSTMYTTLDPTAKPPLSSATATPAVLTYPRPRLHLNCHPRTLASATPDHPLSLRRGDQGG